jgi:hypothetical protein
VTSPPPWIDAVLEGRPPLPTVLVLGGFLTAPPLYRSLVGRLRTRAGAVVVAGVWTPDWLLAAGLGVGPILTRSGRALLEAAARAEEASLGAPVLVLGHSAGGITARLLTPPRPFRGRRLNASGRIGAIVTLGTPHVVDDADLLGHGLSVRATAFANREVPGACFAPRVGYLAVASRSVVGRSDGTPRERATWRVYRDLLGDRDVPLIEGDGLVPVRSALLPGVPSVVLDDAGHGPWPSREWYGSDRFLDRWWPLALEAWHGALRARIELDERRILTDPPLVR